MNGGDIMNNLRYYRLKNGLKQYELAQILKVSKDYIGVIERGKRTPGFKLAKDIADLFLITVDELNFFNEPTNKLYGEAS